MDLLKISLTSCHISQSSKKTTFLEAFGFWGLVPNGSKHYSSLFSGNNKSFVYDLRRGLSKFYEGRSQSFTSLANVKSLEDLMKRGFKNRNYGAKRKSSRSTGGILDQSYKRVYSPRTTISKKPNKTPSSALSCLARRRP